MPIYLLFFYMCLPVVDISVLDLHNSMLENPKHNNKINIVEQIRFLFPEYITLFNVIVTGSYKVYVFAY